MRAAEAAPVERVVLVAEVEVRELEVQGGLILRSDRVCDVGRRGRRVRV